MVVSLKGRIDKIEKQLHELEHGKLTPAEEVELAELEQVVHAKDFDIFAPANYPKWERCEELLEKRDGPGNPEEALQALVQALQDAWKENEKGNPDEASLGRSDGVGPAKEVKK